MFIKFIQFAVTVLVGLFMAVATVSAEQSGSVTKELWINGYAYEAQLKPSHINGVAGSGDDVHFKGHFPEDPDSWIRVSRIGDRWEGLAFVFNRLHTIRSGDSEDRIASFSFSHQEAPQCGLDHMHADSSITPESLTSPAMARAVTANYDILCKEEVDGACLMLELELAFDLEFQSKFPSDYESRAGSILNMVEGFYQVQFGIVFDTLSLTFMGSELFSDTTDPSELLGNVRSNRQQGNIGFLESEQSIFHLITGRSFDGGTAGIAYLGSLCDSSGFATGLSEASNSNNLTSIIVAHEIGHNLGAFHDDREINSCQSNVNIMSPGVRPSYDSFSSCSVDYITSEISSLNAVEQCFNFPADASIAERAGNLSEVTQGESFQVSFDVAYQDTFQPADRLVVEGSVGAGEGLFESVTLNSAACTLTSDTSFSCSQTPVGESVQLSVQAAAGNRPTLTLMQGVTLVSSSGDVKDILPDNDLLQTSFSVAQGSPPDEPDDPDMPTEESGSGSEPTGSSGGGGSIGWFWLLAGLAGFGRLVKRAV